MTIPVGCLLQPTICH